MTNYFPFLQSTESPDPAVAAAARRNIAIRMAAASTPDYQIAFVLGLSLKLLRTTYGTRPANTPPPLSSGPKSSKTPANFLQENPQKRRRKSPDRIPPGSFIVTGPDGEILYKNE